MQSVVIDVETTGLIEGVNDIIQLSIVHYENFSPTGVRFLSYVRPLHPETVNDVAMRMNGLNIDDLIKTAPTPGQVRMSFIQWKQELFGEDKLEPLGHNYASFDMPFIKVFLNDWYSKIFDYHVIDTSLIAMYLQKKGVLQCKSRKLAVLADYFSLPIMRLHDAYEDCLLTLKVYEKLINL